MSPVDDPVRATGDRGERLCIPAMGERVVGLAMGERGEYGDPDPFVLELAVRLGAETRATRARALGCPVLGRGCAGALAVSSLDPMCRSCGLVAGGRGRPAKGCVPAARTGAARGLLRGCFAPPCSSSAASAIVVASFLLREAPHMLGVAWLNISVPCPHLVPGPSKRWIVYSQVVDRKRMSKESTNMDLFFFFLRRVQRISRIPADPTL